MKNLLLILSISILFGNVFGQTETSVKSGIVNGKAKYFITPDYPQEARENCIGGLVEVEILISEEGNVIEAKAISGEQLLLDSAVRAAKKTTFSQTLDVAPVKTRGILVFNFTPFLECITNGVVNKLARFLPQPNIKNIVQSKHLKINTPQIVAVIITVENDGTVSKATAISGHLLLRPTCESVARQAKFSPSPINIKVKALLVYKIKPDGTVDTDVEKDDKEVIGTPINLIQPPSPNCNCRFGKNPSIAVEAKINEQGKVIEAKSWAGHPFLKNLCEKSALLSKFLPTDVKAKITIVYNFESLDEENRNVKLKNIEIKKVEF